MSIDIQNVRLCTVIIAYRHAIDALIGTPMYGSHRLSTYVILDK